MWSFITTKDRKMFGDFEDAEKKVANKNNEEEKIESLSFDSNKITI